MAVSVEKYNKFLDCDIETIIINDRFRKCYYGLCDSNWYRILISSIAFAAVGISLGVLLIENEENYRCIEYEKITPFYNDNIPEILSKKPVEDIKNKITKAVDKMHQMGYGHGNLRIDNIGCDKTGRICILNMDTVYNLKDLSDPPLWLSNWMIECFDRDRNLNNSSENFMALDYYSWRTDWLH